MLLQIYMKCRVWFDGGVEKRQTHRPSDADWRLDGDWSERRITTISEELSGAIIKLHILK